MADDQEDLYTGEASLADQYTANTGEASLADQYTSNTGEASLADQYTSNTGEASLADQYTSNTGEAFVSSAPDPVDEIKESAESFIGEAEAVLAVSNNADDGIFDLVDAYKSRTWDNPGKALQIVETYANKLREKNPGEQNLLTAEETLNIAPVKTGDVDGYIQSWEAQNLAKIKNSNDPLVRAYNDTLAGAIEQVATGAIQANNNEEVSVFSDKMARITLGALPGLAKLTGTEKYLERSLRADSNDTLASAVSSGVGSILSLPLAVLNLPLNAEEFGREQYNKSRAAGADVGTALFSGGIEGVNQAADVLLDKVLLGTKARKSAGFVATGLKKALGEGTQEFAQDKVSDAASVVGLSKNELDAVFTDSAAMSFAAGAIVGGGAQVVMPNAARPSPSTPDTGLSEMFSGIEQDQDLVIPFPETAPMRSVAVVGEPAYGGTNFTLVEDASTGDVDVKESAAPIAESDADEVFILAPDGTITRVVQGEQKQAHTGAVFVSPENAQKIAALQASEPGGEPVIIKQDDLGRPYVEHPNVGNDLEVHDDIVDNDPVLIPEETAGHVLQFSERQNELDSVEHSATVSNGTANTVSTVGAQKVAESSIADKLRASNNLNPVVRDLLGLNDDFATNLTYLPNSNVGTRGQVDETFAQFDNNYVLFANDLLAKDYDDLTSIEGVAAAIAGTALSAKGNSVRATDPVAAAKYDTLAVNLWIASQKVGTPAGQELQQRTQIPMTGENIIVSVKSDVSAMATAKVAQQTGRSIQSIEGIIEENTQLDNLSTGLNERETIITETARVAEERHDAPDKQVADIEKEIQTLENDASPEVTAAQKDLNTVEQRVAEVERSAAALEKEADDIDIDTAQEGVSDNVQTLSKKVEELQAKPIDVDRSKLDALKAKRVKSEDQSSDPDTQAAAIEKEIQTLENDASPEVTAAQEDLNTVENRVVEVERSAAALEKEADDIDTVQEEVSDNVKTLSKKVEDLQAKPIEVDSSKLDALKVRRTRGEQEGSQVKAAREKVTTAKGEQKAAARLELTKAINEEKLRGQKERAALEAEIKLAEEAQQEKRNIAQEEKAREIKALKEQIAQDKSAASASKKAEALAKRKQANELRAESKRLRAEKQAALVEARKVRAAENVERKKDLKEKLAAVRLDRTKATNEEKLRGQKERAALEAEIKLAAEEHQEERKFAQEEKAREIKALKDQIAQDKSAASASKKADALAKRKQANELRAESKRLRAEKQTALVEARKVRATDTAERKKALKEKLSLAKEERAATRQIRKEQLAIEKEKIKAAKEALNQDRERINTRKEANRQITEAVDKYKSDFAAKLTPEEVKRISDLVQLIKTQTGITRKNALDELGRTIARIKGIKILPGADPLSTFWQANVLSSVSTNTANIVGNFVTPVRQVIIDLATASPNKAYRFIRGWASALFSKRTLADVGAGFRGELPSRSTEEVNAGTLNDLTSGTFVAQERDPVRLLQAYFGKGLFGKFLSYPAVTLRLLGAMDAVFSRASKEGRIARDDTAYAQYLALKASEYNQHATQARNEQAQLESLGVATAKNFVNMRADELSYAARPEVQRNKITRASNKDVFQEEGGPRGLIGSAVGKVLNAIANVPISGGRYKDLNAKKTVASALGFANKTARDNVSIDEIYPLVVQGLAQGKTLVINGAEITGGNTKQLLGSLLQAVTNKQVISLKGDSIRPFKYAVGMFVNTGSQILDISIETLPGIGFLDKRLGGKWREYTADEKAELYGTQVASTILTGSLLATFLPNMDDEDSAYFYVYGGMRDEKLRKSYEAKGIRPFSFRVGKTVISYKDIPGINLILGGIGDLSDTHMVAKRTPDRPITVGSSMQAVAVGAMYAATQLSLLKNIGTMADLLALQDTQSATSALDVLSNIASGYVPWAGAGRELERFAYGDLSRPKNITNRMIQGIPFAKFVSDNKPALNMFGEELRPHVYPGISRFVGESTNSYELDWVLRNGYSVSLPKAGNALTKKQLEGYTQMQESEDPDNFEPYLTEDDQRAYILAVGPELKNILGDFANSDPQGYDEKVQRKLNDKVKKMKARFKKQILNQ